MTDHNTPVSALRQRMLEDMQLRKLAAKTHSAYIRAVKKLIGFVHRSPVSADAEDLQRLQLRLASGIRTVLVPPAPGLFRPSRSTAALYLMHCWRRQLISKCQF